MRAAKLKSLDQYIKSPPKRAARRRTDDAAVRAMFNTMEKQQKESGRGAE